MKLKELNYCPGTLAEGFSTYSPSCLRKLFNGKKVSHVLSYDQPQQNEEVSELFMENRKRISISGVQEKLSFVLEKNILRLTKEEEQGTYILKPIPRDLKKIDQVPANEHLTMQIAKQVYGLNTAENAMVFFKNGSPAYITKRFDIKTDGSKWGKEDFATLAGKTNENAGPNFKYDFSYEEAGLLIQKYVSAWRIEIEKYFSLDRMVGDTLAIYAELFGACPTRQLTTSKLMRISKIDRKIQGERLSLHNGASAA